MPGTTTLPLLGPGCAEGRQAPGKAGAGEGAGRSPGMQPITAGCRIMTTHRTRGTYLTAMSMTRSMWVITSEDRTATRSAPGRRWYRRPGPAVLAPARSRRPYRPVYGPLIRDSPSYDSSTSSGSDTPFGCWFARPGGRDENSGVGWGLCSLCWHDAADETREPHERWVGGVQGDGPGMAAARAVAAVHGAPGTAAQRNRRPSRRPLSPSHSGPAGLGLVAEERPLLQPPYGPFAGPLISTPGTAPEPSGARPCRASSGRAGHSKVPASSSGDMLHARAAGRRRKPGDHWRAELTAARRLPCGRAPLLQAGPRGRRAMARAGQQAPVPHTAHRAHATPVPPSQARPPFPGG